MPGWDGTGTPENFLIVRVLYYGLITLFNKVHCSIFRADEPVQEVNNKVQDVSNLFFWPYSSSMTTELPPPLTLVQIFLPLILSKAFSARLPTDSRPHGAPVRHEH